MVLFRDEPGQAGRFEPLLQEELMDGLPAFFPGTRAEHDDDAVAPAFQILDGAHGLLHVFESAFLNEIVPAFRGAVQCQIREEFGLREREERTVLAVFPEQLLIMRMEAAEIVAHGLDDIRVVFLDDDGGHARLAGAGLARHDVRRGALQIARLVHRDGRPHFIFKKQAHFVFVKGAFLFDELFRELYPRNGPEDLIGDVLALDGKSLPEHGDLLVHGDAVAGAELHPGHFPHGFAPQIVQGGVVVGGNFRRIPHAGQQIVNDRKNLRVHFELDAHGGDLCGFHQYTDGALVIRHCHTTSLSLL